MADRVLELYRHAYDRFNRRDSTQAEALDALGLADGR
jgi:hypothetical protein